MNILINKYTQKTLKSVLYFKIILCFSGASSQIPNLYTLNNYSVFTAVGAISNTGLTNVNGNLGTNVGAFTGFPPGNISGSTHIADSNSALTAIDIDSVYAQISRLNCDTTIDSSLGPNQVIYPGVHCITSASTLNGNVTFDGLNKTNSYFIIKINGAFSSANLSEVLLNDSASSKNIYWLINGAVSLGDSSVFMGNIIGNGAISLLDHAVLKGKALTRQGAISMYINTIDTTPQMNPLPLKVKDYVIKLEDKKVHLYFTYLPENDDKTKFNFERSVDGTHWETVCSIDIIGKQINQLFHLMDSKPMSNQSYYRLSIWNQSKTIYFKTQSIFIKANHQIIVYPNPNHGKFTIINMEKNEIDFSFKIYSFDFKSIYESFGNESELDLSSIAQGLYFIQLFIDGDLLIKKLIIE